MKIISIYDDADYRNMIIYVRMDNILFKNYTEKTDYEKSIFNRIAEACMEKYNPKSICINEIFKNSNRLIIHVNNSKEYEYYFMDFRKKCNTSGVYFIKHKLDFCIGRQFIEIDNFNFEIDKINESTLAKLLVLDLNS